MTPAVVFNWIWSLPGFLVVWILVVVFCIFCDRLSSRRSSSHSDSRRDTVPLDDLLCIQSLADPESVFSEAGSCEFPPLASPHGRCLYEGDSGEFQEPLGDSSCSQGEKQLWTSRGIPSRQNNMTEAQSEGRNIHSWSQAMLPNAPPSDGLSLLSNRLFRSSVEFLGKNDKTVHEISSTVKTKGSPRTSKHREVSRKIQFDSGGLKIHRDSITRDSLPFLNSTRCSFSHEVGHVVHGNKATRPSLPKTKEADISEAYLRENEDVKIQTESTKFTLQEQTHKRFESNYGTAKVNSNFLGPSENNEKQNINKSSELDIVNNVQNQNKFSENGKQRINNSVYSSSGSNNEERNLNLCISTKNQTESVTMRRCFSLSREAENSTFTAQSTSEKKTFSLNLKIDLHFDNNSGSREHLPKVVCSPMVKYANGDLNASSDNIPCNSKIDSSDINKATNEVKAESEVETKQRLLEKSFARKVRSPIDDLYLLERKRCSAPIVSAQNIFEGVTGFPFGRRFSETECVPLVFHLTKKNPNNISNSVLYTGQSNVDERSNSVVRVGSTSISDTIMENHEEDNHCLTPTLEIDYISECKSLAETRGDKCIKKENIFPERSISSYDIRMKFVGQNSNTTYEQIRAGKQKILEDTQKFKVIYSVSRSNNDLDVDCVPRSQEDIDYGTCKTSMSDIKLCFSLTPGNSKIGLSPTQDNSKPGLSPTQDNSKSGVSSNLDSISADLASALLEKMDTETTIAGAVKKAEASEALQDEALQDNEDKFGSISPSPHQRASTVRTKRTDATAAWHEVINAWILQGVSLKDDSWTRPARNDHNYSTFKSHQRNRHVVLFGKETREAETSEDNANANEKQNSYECISPVQSKDASREPYLSSPTASGTGEDSTVRAIHSDAAKLINADSVTDAGTQLKDIKSVLKTAYTKVRQTTRDQGKTVASLERGEINVTAQQHNYKKESTSKVKEPNLSPNRDPEQALVLTFHTEEFSSKKAGSDDSDYDNPWDDLDDAVMRASIRYNRRPSRVAAGDTKTLLLKSAEDLGRLLEKAEKQRQMRQAISSCQVIAASDHNVDNMTIPFTRYSPLRHTVKTIQPSIINTCHTSEDFLSSPRTAPRMNSLLRQGEVENYDFLRIDSRRSMSLTTKMKSKELSPDIKRKK